MSRDLEHREKIPQKRMIAMENLFRVPENILLTPVERGFTECNCPKDCILHGDCKLCTAYHARKGQLPRCER